jgi:hypothetical protein
MLCTEVNAVCSETHTEHTDALYVQNIECLNVKRGGTCSNH